MFTDGFFSPQVSESHSNPTRVASDESGMCRRVVRNPYRMENHIKCIFSHI